MKKLVHILVIILILSASSFGQLPKKYSAQEVKSDLKYLYETLEKSTYDLFALVTKRRNG